VGEHTFAVRAIDGGGTADPTPATATWTIVGPDETPPQTTITSGPAATTTSVDATFTFSANEVGSTFECSLDGAAFEPCESPVELSDLALGSHTFEVRATDVAGNADDTPASHTWEVVPDTTAPETTITSGASGSIGSTNVVFQFTGTDDTTPAAGLDFECALDGGAFESCSSPHEVGGLALGDHTFQVRAVDAALNADLSPASNTWTVVDTVAPDTSIDSGPTDPTEATSATFTFSASEAGATFECALDGAPFAACTSPHEETGLSVGVHTFEVRALDSAGNADPTPDAFTWTVVDTTPPDTAITGGPPATTELTTASFTFTATQTGSTFECSLDGSVFAECGTPHEVTGLALGAHTLQVRAVDPADNVDPTPASRSWTVVDTTAPETTIDSGPAASTESTTASFTFSATEAGSTFECALDGAAFATCTSPVNLTGLGVGSHTFQVRAIDALGNTDATVASFTWTVVPPPPDCGSPTTYPANADSWIDQGSPTSNNGTDSTLKVMSKSGSGNLRALVRFALPSSVPAGCVVESATLRVFADGAANGRTLQALRITSAWTEGGVTWSNQPATTGAAATTTSGTGYREWNVTSQVQAMYAAGALHGFLIRDATENQDAEQQFSSREKPENQPQLVVTFAEAPPPDTTPPETTADSGPSGSTTDTSATFTFSSNEAGSTFECSLDSAAFSGCASPLALTGLGVGAHELRVRAVDAAGNVDGSPVVYTWTVEAPPPPPPDTTPPETTVDSGPAASTSITSASFAFSSSEAASTFECSLDGAGFAACTSPAAYSGLALGSHTFEVRATDPAGNVDGSPASHTWSIVAACAGGTVTAGAVADSWVLQSSPSSNNGSDSVLKVDSKNGSSNARSLVRFDLPAVPAGCQVTGATLRLFAGSFTSGRTLQALRINAAWTEGGVTWSNQPATTGTAATTPSGSGWREWNVLSQVQAMYTSTNHGFLIRDASENGPGREQQLHSREKAPDNPPQLVITFG
jgi:hypothetical protein